MEIARELLIIGLSIFTQYTHCFMQSKMAEHFSFYNIIMSLSMTVKLAS